MEIRQCEVAVIGSGGAGLRAAIEARRCGARTVLLTKGPAAYTGATGSANYSFCTVVRPPDSNPLFRADTQKGASDLALPELVRVMVEGSRQAAQDLESFGVPWDRGADGDYALGGLPGHTIPRALHVDKRTGKHVSSALLSAARQAGVEIVEYAFVLDLLLDGGRLAGVVCVDLAGGEPFVLSCGAAVLATGGAGQLFQLNTNPNDLTGDGVAMAFRAGAACIDMEFYQFYPTVLVHPHGAYGVELPTGQLIPGGARLYNRAGEDFFEARVGAPVRQVTRDTLSRGIALEIAAGGGTPAGGVFLDATQLPQSQVVDNHVKYLATLGVDVVRAPQQVAPGAHFMMGGVRIDPECHTGIERLVAAGEVTGGVHGANRLAGNALPDTQVFGTIAGREAVRAAAAGPAGSPDLDRAAERAREAARPLTAGSGPSPIALRRELQALMNHDAGVLRSRDSLEHVLAELDRLGDEARWMATRSRSPAHNLEWLEALELPNLLLAARLVATAALARTETRGAHNRLDHPEADAAWQRHLVLSSEGDGVGVRTEEAAAGA